METNRTNNSAKHSAFVAAIDLSLSGKERIILVEHRVSVVRKGDGTEFTQDHGWGLPGGMQDDNKSKERPDETAEREFEEEVGGEKINVGDIVYSERPDPGLEYCVYTFFANARGINIYPFETSDPLILSYQWFFLRNLPLERKDRFTGQKKIALYNSAFERIIAILLLLKKDGLAVEILRQSPWQYSSSPGMIGVLEALDRYDLAKKFKILNQDELDVLEARDDLISPSEQDALKAILRELSSAPPC